MMKSMFRQGTGYFLSSLRTLDHSFSMQHNLVTFNRGANSLDDSEAFPPLLYADDTENFLIDEHFDDGKNGEQTCEDIEIRQKLHNVTHPELMEPIPGDAQVPL
eukprot:scpid104945/ scgid17315/ 